MTKDIRATIRTIATNDTTRAIAATAAGELIKKAATPGKKRTEQPDGRVVASGLGGFAAGAGAATLATATVKGIGKLVSKRRRPLFADVPKKAAAGTRKAVEVPKEAVDRFTSGLRDQVSGGSRPSKTTRRTASTSSARKPSAKSSGGGKSGASGSSASGTRTRTRAKSTRSSSGSSAKATRSSNGGSAKATRSSSGTSSRRTRSSNGGSSAKSTRSSNGGTSKSRASGSGSRAKSTRSSNGSSSGRGRAPASASR